MESLPSCYLHFRETPFHDHFQAQLLLLHQLNLDPYVMQFNLAIFELVLTTWLILLWLVL